MNEMERKPGWLKVRYNQEAVEEVARLMGELKLCLLYTSPSPRDRG